MNQTPTPSPAPTSGQLDSERLAALTLQRLPGLGPVLAGRLVERFGSPERALEASPAAMSEIRGIGQGRARAATEGRRRAEREAERELRRAADLGATLCTPADPDYPSLLRELPDRPIVLSILGELTERDDASVAIVGSRRCTHYGLEQAGRFGAAMGTAGLTVVSGGARGIDSAAHRGSLGANGRTVAVLGSGLGRPYPPENKDLFARIGSSSTGGAVVSELPIDAPPEPTNFPARNRIISGLSLGVLVIEAGRQSGALITARVAAEEQGREVMAIPGRIDSAESLGSNALLRDGATLVTEPGDVIAALEPQARHAHQGTRAERFAPSPPAGEPDAAPAPNPDGPPGRLLETLTEPLDMESLIERSGLSGAEVRVHLTTLELAGLVRRRGTMLERARG
ncbi:MAG: DNA-processing protein DprA [Planctomycetota bacterium]